MFDCSKICIDKESAEPLHIQLIRELRRLIRAMNQDEYDVLPSERFLCSCLKLHRSTVHRAYQELLDSGIVRRQPNKSIIPNISARKKLEGHLPAIGIVIPCRFSQFIEYRKNTIQYLKGIFDRAAEKGYAVLLLELPASDTPEEERKDFINTHFSGLTGALLLGDRMIDNDQMLSELFHYTGIPQVALAGEVDLPHIGSVQCRFDQAANDMAEYFKQQKVHSLGIIAPRVSKNPGREFHYFAHRRTDSMMQIFKEHGLEMPEEWIQPENLQEAVSRQKVLPDGFWCYNDEFARELLNVLEKNNIRQPIHIGGFDAVAPDPRIVTSRQPYLEIGAAAVDLILEHFEHGITAQNRFRYVDADFCSKRQ